MTTARQEQRLVREIAREWGQNAAERCRQLANGLDFSHDSVLVPTILQLAGTLRGKKVIDVGCGCGFLTEAASRTAASVLGVDISHEMITHARRRFGKRPNLSFEATSIQERAGMTKPVFDVCLANMSLMLMPSLDSALVSMRSILKPGGRLVFSIPHPCTWNTFRRDEPSESFDYWESHAVVAPFRITLDPKPLPVASTFFHRALGKYVEALVGAGFRIESLIEPNAPRNSPPKYLKGFSYPRFAVFSVVANIFDRERRPRRHSNGLS